MDRTTPLDLLTARYGEAPEAAPPHWSAALDVMLNHRSVRAYRPDPLPEAMLDTLMAAGQSAATSSNLQTWSVVAVTDPARKARLAAFAGGQRHITEAPLFLVFLADLSRLDRLAAREGAPAEGLAYFESFLVAAIDAALAAQNVVTAAESLGLGTVYIGAMRNKPEAVAEELGLPPKAVAVFGLCVGYADAARETDVKPRLKAPVILHRERYDAGADEAAIAAYDAALTAFQTAQRMPAVGWRHTALDRVAGAHKLSGRDRLVAELNACGFALR